MIIEKNISKFVKSIYRKLKLKLFHKTNTKKYERYNFVSDNGDSIYIPSSKDELTAVEKGQVFVSEEKIEEIVNRIIDQRFGSK